MRTLLEIGLSNALVACVPAVAAILVGLWTRRPALVHALWLLVLLKLVTPPLIRVGLPWPAEAAPVATMAETPPEPAPAVVEQEDLVSELLPSPTVEPVEIEAPLLEVPLPAEPIAEGVPAEVAEEAPAKADTSVSRPTPWLEGIAVLWLVGSLGWYLLAARRAWLFSRTLRQASGASETWYDRVAALADLVGLRECPEIRLVPGRLAPMVWGVFRPVLLLPAGLCAQMSAAAMDTLIVHELAHLRRRDHWVRVLEFVALGLFWWHPLAWFACRELRRAEEQCCDAWVVRALPGSARAYAVALVDALDFLSEPRPAVPPLACGIGEMADLKRRLTMILSRSTKPALGWLAGLAVFALAGVLFLMPGVGEAQSQPKPRQPGSEDDLKKIHDELRHKMAEIEALKKKAEDIARAREERARKDEQDRRMGTGKRLEMGKQGGQTIRIEISGFSGKPEDVEKLAKTLEKALGGKESKVIILRQGQGGMSGMMMPMGGDRKDMKDFRDIPPQVAEWLEKMKKDGGQQQWQWNWGGGPNVPPVPAKSSQPAQPAKMGLPGAAPHHGGDKRVEALESKLDAIMKELEAIRKEMKARPIPGQRSGGGFPGGGSGFGGNRRDGEGGQPKDKLPPGGGVPKPRE